MPIICGVDSCRGGWIAVARVLETDAILVRREDRLVNILYGPWTPALTAVDIPIGLTDTGPRECDVAARRFLGAGRGSSVFPAPNRPLLDASSYEEACNLRLGIDGKKISKQTYAIFPKIREMDEIILPSIPLRDRVREVHPEVCFSFLAGGNPMKHSKRKAEGKQERRVLLESHYGSWLGEALSQRKPLGCAENDILDAFVALWTAERIMRGEAQTLPENPPIDRHGLRMEIVA